MSWEHLTLKKPPTNILTGDNFIDIKPTLDYESINLDRVFESGEMWVTLVNDGGRVSVEEATGVRTAFNGYYEVKVHEDFAQRMIEMGALKLPF